MPPLPRNPLMLQLLATVLALTAAPPPATCTYDIWTWSVVAHRAVDHRHVSKPYSEITAEEKASDWSATGCTICREDQETVAVAGTPSVLVCRHFAPQIRQALQAAVEAGARIDKLVGYRVGRSGGPIVNGKRTQYGWHAFGEALDINPDANGLYGHCARKAPAPRTSAELAGCQRRIGGAWRPEDQPARSLTADGAIVAAFRRLVDWRWGGERTDTTKDLMHVSPDGY